MELFLNILKTALKFKASDIHLKAGAPPIVRVDGNLYPFKDFPRLSVDSLKEMADSMMGRYRKSICEIFMRLILVTEYPGSDVFGLISINSVVRW